MPFLFVCIADFRSTLAELEPGSRTALTVFLPLDLAGVTSEITGLLEGFTVFIRNLQKGSADAMLDGTRLATDPSTIDIDLHIELTRGTGHLERLHDDHFQSSPAEVFVGTFLVDGDASLAGGQIYPGY